MTVSIQDRFVAALVVLKDQVTLGGPEVRVFRAHERTDAEAETPILWPPHAMS